MHEPSYEQVVPPTLGSKKALVRGHRYLLQIDSHTRFAAGWDEALLSMLAACDSPRPVLSTYPLQYDLGTREVRSCVLLGRATLGTGCVRVTAGGRSACVNLRRPRLSVFPRCVGAGP